MELEIGRRLASNQLCILLGIPLEELQQRLGPAPIPTAPLDVAVGIPADLLRRRPDVRRAERQAAAQCAQIGVAESDFYPAHRHQRHLRLLRRERSTSSVRESAFLGSIGPAFNWNILNYGRILNNVRLQDAKFQELVATYQNTVLAAGQDVENGLVTFLRAQERVKYQQASVDDAMTAVKITLEKYEAGTTDLTRVTLLQQTLVQQQDVLAQAQGEIALGLIQVYRALGGGWQIRMTGCQAGPLPPPTARPLEAAPELLPAPKVAPPAGQRARPAPKASGFAMTREPDRP